MTSELGRIGGDLLRALAVVLVIVVIGAVALYLAGRAIVCDIPIIGKLLCRSCWLHPGSKLDPLTGDCYVCPAGMTRTAQPVSSKTACAGYGLGVATDPQGEAYCDTKYGEDAFADPDGKCWTCPDDMVRSVDPVTAKTACEAGAGALDAKTKSYCHKFSDDAFPDPDGKCWTCPDGMIRSADPVTAGTACEAGVGALSKGAVDYCHKLSGDAFPDPDGGCWECPDDMKRTVAAVTSGSACAAGVGALSAGAVDHCHKVAGSGAFPDPNGGCYGCPPGWIRTANPVTSDKACSAGVGALSRGAVDHCHSISSRAFPDPDGGCWECPSDWNRTIFAVTGKTACIKRGSFAHYGRADRVGDWVSGAVKRGAWVGPATKAGSWVAPASDVGDWVSPATDMGGMTAPATIYGKATG